MEAGKVTRNQIVFFFGRRQMKTRLNSMHNALYAQQGQSIAKNCMLVRVQSNAAMSEFLRDIKEVTGPAPEIENVTAWAAVERNILGAFDVTFNPEARVSPAMYLLDPGWIFLTESFPCRIFLKLLQQWARIDGMEGTMNVLAQTADDVGIKKLSQFMREIHGWMVRHDCSHPQLSRGIYQNLP